MPESVSEPASEAADADYTAYSITFDVPEGFEQVDASGTGASVIYQAADGSSINVVIMENNDFHVAGQGTVVFQHQRGNYGKQRFPGQRRGPGRPGGTA